MKSKTIISLALIAIAIALMGTDYNQKNAQTEYTEPQSNADSMFLICAVNSGRDVSFSNYPQFGANAWHIYCGVSDSSGGWPGVSNDYYNVPFTAYQNELTNKIRLHDSLGFRSVMERPKTVYLCNGQRSIYECETVANVDPDYWFYTYNTHEAGTDVIDNSIHGSGQWVRYCDSGSAAGYVVKELISNREQARKQPNLFALSDDSYPWYVMPRIRIDSNTPLNTRVCTVFSIDWNGNIIDSTQIKSDYFRRNPQQLYNGEYLEDFYFLQNRDRIPITIPPGVICPGDPKRYTNWNDTVLTDFRVYWYGECDMWIDYVKVENQPAHELFDSILFNWKNEIRGEANIALTGYDPDNPVPNNFYTEEFEFNSLSCIGYVNKIIEDETQGRLTLMANLQYNMFRYHVPPDANGYVEQFTPARLKKYLVDSAGLNIIIDVGYYLTGWTGNEQGVMIFDPSLSPPKSYHPNTLYNGDYDKSSGILSYKTSVSDYEEKLQNLLDLAHGTDDGLIPVFRRSDSMSKLPGGPAFINLMQAHLWWEAGHKLKEPSNEELSLLANLAISYGSKGIMYFAYDSKGSFDSAFYMRGFTDTTLQPRTVSVYGQNKWNAAVSLNTKLSNLRPHLMSFDDAGRHSYVYRLSAERNQMSADTYLKSLKAFPAFEFAPDPVPDLTNHSPEIYSESYLQATVFEKTNEPLDRAKYFFIVNRRCSPFINYNSSDNIGGRRLVTMKVNETHLQGFSNWTLYDLESNDSLRTISSKDTNEIFLGDFLPGEAKLYKLAPVMQEGGTLVADEDCGGFEFECRGEVNNDGHDISIVPNTTILFANSSARISMNGGNFKSGIYPDESLPITLKSVGTTTWKGMKLIGCSNVEIFSTDFEDVSPYPVDSTYAVEITDCGYVNISNSGFIAEPSTNTGALLISYTSDTSGSRIEGVYLYNNNFNMNLNAMPAVSVIATGYVIFPMLMEWNSFESNSVHSSVAILLSNVTGGAIKENNFTGYDKTVFMLGSSMDFYGNYIIGSDQSSIGIVQHSASNANLSASGEMFTGGYNSITAEGQTAKCIQLSNSYLLIDEGYNIFRLEDSQTNNYHLEGTIPNDVGADPYPAENNCFQLGNGLLVKHNLRWIDEAAINLDTVPSSCNSERPENLIVFNLENNINDTVRYESGGSGGGESNVKLEIKNYKYGEASGAGSISETEILKALNDSVSIYPRKRNYEKVSVLCREMLTDYADSVNDASIISKLYLAELKQDTSNSRMSELKSFLESYILNNPEKEMMIRQTFYFVQKCKVSLGLYESAMTGFQQIINQFPYSYEGLLASWDYAATSLLNSQGGSGGGARSKYDHEFRDEGVISYIDDPNDVYDSRKFSNDDRKTLNENLSKSFSSQVSEQTHEIKSLEEKLTKNEASNSEKKKYQEMITLKEVVKARKPETVAMHVSMISDDLSRIIKSTGGEVSDVYEANTLPIEFALHQNYPNPFNPATKISFDLPQDSKVNLVVYDLLGREVAKLVNNEFKVAGTYTYDFNAASLSSGVYFYRLVVSSSNPLEAGKFSETKRMVLLK